MRWCACACDQAACSSPCGGHAQGAEREKADIADANDFYFPGKRYREFDSDRQDRFVMRMAMKMTSTGVTDEIRSKWMDIWRQCDEGLASKLEAKCQEMMAA